MTGTLVLGFTIGWICAMPIAGPIAFFICHRGFAGRFHEGLALGAGATVTEVFWCLAILLGVHELLDIWPATACVARSLGGLLLIGLGIYFYARRKTAARRITGENGDQNAGRPAPLSHPRLRDEFRLGMTLNAVNFSVPFNWLAVITIAVSLGLEPGRAPLAFALGMGLGTIAWYALLLRLIITWSERLHTSTVVRVQQGFAVLLVCAGSYVVWHAWL